MFRDVLECSGMFHVPSFIDGLFCVSKPPPPPKKNASIVKQAYLISKNLHSINNSGFYINFMNMIEQYHLSNVDLESFDNDTVKRHSTYMKEIYIYIFWQHSVTRTFNEIRILQSFLR